jgi:hypothetical protein
VDLASLSMTKFEFLPGKFVLAVRIYIKTEDKGKCASIRTALWMRYSLYDYHTPGKIGFQDGIVYKL